MTAQLSEDTFIEHRPRGLVATAVTRYVAYAESAPPVRRELPGGQLHIIFSAGPRLRIEGPGAPIERRSFVIGLHDSASLTTPLGGSCGVQVSLSPASASRLFAQPLEALHNACPTLEEVFGAAGAALESRLDSEPEPARAFAQLTCFLEDRLRAAPAVPADVAWLLDQLEGARGCVPIAVLCDELGWSRKRLAATMRRHAGVTPKQFARLLRFEHAVERLRAGEPAIEAALESGFADQAHMCREVRAFAGVTVRELLSPCTTA